MGSHFPSLGGNRNEKVSKEESGGRSQHSLVKKASEKRWEKMHCLSTDSRQQETHRKTKKGGEEGKE